MTIGQIGFTILCIVLVSILAWRLLFRNPEGAL